MLDIQIENKTIGLGKDPFIIAELSANHNGSLERALTIVDAIADAGADAVKLQTYTADTMTIDIRNGEFMVEDPNGLWKGNALYDLYQQAYTPWEWHKPIFDRCRKHGMVGFSTAYDATSVDFLESLKIPVYKIASFENNDLALIRRIAKTHKPVIISTGMAYADEMVEAVTTLRQAGCKELVALKCTSIYPAPPEDTHIKTIPHMQELFQCPIGLSDHTLGIGVSLAAIALGATVIERHVTLSRKDGGVDSAFSLEPQELKQLVQESKRIVKALGSVRYSPTEKELKMRNYRRSIYVVKDIPAGGALTPDNIRVIRPGMGMPPKYIEHVLGKQVTQALKRGTPLRWDHLS